MTILLVNERCPKPSDVVVEEINATPIKVLKDDLDEMVEKLKYSSYPIVTTVCSGIDFFGGLIDGLRSNNSKLRSVKFITEFMGKVNPQYSKADFAELFYTCVRCNLIHQVEAPGIWHGINKAPEYHLHIIEFDDFKSLFVHMGFLKDEFLKAADIFDIEVKSRKNFRETVLYNFECSFTKEELLFYKKLGKVDLPTKNIHSLTDAELEKMETFFNYQ